MQERTRFDLPEGDLPTAWFNIMPDLAVMAQPLPPLHPGTLQPVTPDLLAPLFPEALILQRCRPTNGSTSRERSWTCTGSGGPRPCTVQCALRRP